jgi:hypothetical protein
MQLWWPESVPYERDGVRVQVSQKTSVEQDTPADATPRMPSSLSYRQTLRSDQFRLVYLSAVPDPDYPIHVTLEAYADDEHPEYECASYTWGGEDGNSMPCQPVYVTILGCTTTDEELQLDASVLTSLERHKNDVGRCDMHKPRKPDREGNAGRQDEVSIRDVL